MSNATELTCPSGGQWYACGTGTSKFVGCCTSDPCSKGCVQGNVRPGGFSLAEFGSFPDASCETGSDFYSCTAAPSFWGCCKSNPCANSPASTCREGDLVPAFMGRPEQFNAYAPSALPNPSSAARSGSNNRGVIGGAVGGGLAAAILIGVLVFFFCRRRKRKQQLAHHEAGVNASTPMMKERTDESVSVQYGGQSPPPTYSSPNPNIYQFVPPTKDFRSQSYQEYRQEAGSPQELPVDTTPPFRHTPSELPAEAVPHNSHRISELPSGTAQVTAELESPQNSPKTQQEEFPSDLIKRANQRAGTVSGSAL